MERRGSGESKGDRKERTKEDRTGMDRKPGKEGRAVKRGERNFEREGITEEGKREREGGRKL